MSNLANANAAIPLLSGLVGFGHNLDNVGVIGIEPIQQIQQFYRLLQLSNVGVLPFGTALNCSYFLVNLVRLELTTPSLKVRYSTN